MRIKVKEVGVDFDGPMFKCHELITQVTCREFGVDSKRLANIMPTELYGKLINTREILTKQQGIKLDRLLYQFQESGAGLDFFDFEALRYLPEIIRQHNVCVITKRTGGSLGLAENLARRIGLLKMNFHGVDPSQSKLSVARAKNLEYFIDDEPDNLADLRGQVKNLFLYSQPYNQMFDCDGWATRVHSWQEFSELLKR